MKWKLCVFFLRSKRVTLGGEFPFQGKVGEPEQRFVVVCVTAREKFDAGERIESAVCAFSVCCEPPRWEQDTFYFCGVRIRPLTGTEWANQQSRKALSFGCVLEWERKRKRAVEAGIVLTIWLQNYVGQGVDDVMDSPSKFLTSFEWRTCWGNNNRR